MEKTLVVMAAGLSTRYGALKQLEKVGPSGEFIIDYSVYDAIKAGFTKVIFIIRKEIAQSFRETIGKRLEGHIKVVYVFQNKEDIPMKKYLVEKREKPWGTVQAILASKEEIENDFLIINADDFYGFDSFKKALKFLEDNHEENTYASINYPFNEACSKNGAVKRAVCYLDNNYITNLVESKVSIQGDYALAEPLDGEEAFKIALNHPVAVNLFAVKHSFLTYLEEYFLEFFKQDDETILNSEALLTDCLKELLENKKIKIVNIVSESSWLGLTYHEDLAEVKEKINDLVKRGDYPVNLWE